MKNFGVAILILVLLGGAGAYNYRRNQAAEEQEAARVYKSYSAAEIAALIEAYEQEIETLESRYDAAKNRSVEKRGGALIDERIEAFEQAQKAGSSTRSMGAVVAQKESILRELRREQSLRASSGGDLMLHLRRLVGI